MSAFNTKTKKTPVQTQNTLVYKVDLSLEVRNTFSDGSLISVTAKLPLNH